MRGKGNIFMKGTVILLSALLFQGAVWAGAEELTVMTRNLYLGADLAPAMTAQDEDECVGAVYDILGVIACNNFPERAAAMAAEIVENLRREGFDLHLEDAVREAGDALSVGRPHIARAAGAKPEQMNAFFEEYLVPGAKAFVPRRWPTADEAVELIHEAGGVAVVAHPYWDVKDPAQVEELIRALDVDGVEAFYPDHSSEQTAHVLRLCEDLRLTPTASSDYHGPAHKTFSRFGAYQTYGLGEPQVPARP